MERYMLQVAGPGVHDFKQYVAVFLQVVTGKSYNVDADSADGAGGDDDTGAGEDKGKGKGIGENTGKGKGKGRGRGKGSGGRNARILDNTRDDEAAAHSARLGTWAKRQ